jgi:hypothetical protein
LTFGHSAPGHLLVVSHTDREERTRIISARRATRKEESNMKKDKTEPKDDELRPEYDLAQLRRGVRGKYLERYCAGTNLALLAPDVRAAFPTDEAVNQALRALMQSQGAPDQRLSASWVPADNPAARRTIG